MLISQTDLVQRERRAEIRAGKDFESDWIMGFFVEIVHRRPHRDDRPGLDKKWKFVQWG